jgi:signal transduction histidine kinase/ActR/RegA family two-component response regulator
MQNRPYHHIALWGFLIGILFIVFIQFFSGRNINRLTQLNSNLLNEIRLQNSLHRLESDILALESDVRGAIVSGDSVFIKDIHAKTSNVKRDLALLSGLLNSDQVINNFPHLQSLVEQKTTFNDSVVNTLKANGKEAAEALVGTGRGRILRDSISSIISTIDRTKQAELVDITDANKRSGMQARIWGIIMGVLACGLLVYAFWYVLNLSSRQQRIITHLNESERKIKEASSLKEQFLANMSHEIRTPMNAIIGFTNILKRTDLEPEQRKYVQNIHSAGENLLALINDILDLSKIEAGMIQLEDTNFSLRSLLSSIAAMFDEKTKEKNLYLQTEVKENVPDILTGDAVRLTQILVNLLSNGIKFTEKGGVKVIVEAVRLDLAMARLRICIIDSGIGIAKEKQAAIFERFQQAEAETTRRFGGTGLGLSIVKQLIELQGGTLTLKSQPGKGSEFIIEMEYKLPDEEKMLSEALAAAEVNTISLNEIKVLIAEDNPMNQQLIKHLMKNWNIQHVIVNNGAEAVEALKKENYTVVLMDIQMPEMDGYTATEVIRKELRLQIPIIAMTAHAMMGEKEKCLQLGMNDYISKPLKETILYNIIAQYSYQGMNL